MAMISIHKMTLADLEGVHRVGCQSFADPWSLQAIQDELANDLAWYLVARDGEEVLGFAGAWLVFDEAQITNIAVDPSHRNQGIARQLLQALIGQLRQKKMAVVFLEVRCSNTAAKALYASLGFQTVGCRREFYPDREDALVMSLELT